MSKIEFSVEINPEKKEVAKAAMALIAAMAEVPTITEIPADAIKYQLTEQVPEKTEETPAAEKPKKKGPKKEAPMKKVEEIEVEAEEVTPETKTPSKKKHEPEEEEESDITVEDIRKLLIVAVRDHRDAIKAKLTELGATSASTLDKEHFGTFHSYLKSLK